MRGTKLTAWHLPPLWTQLQAGDARAAENSTLSKEQEKMRRATVEVLQSVAGDVRGGLLETVGVESSLSFEDERCAMILQLPEGADADLIARAIDAENVEAWLDAEKRVCIAVNPWYSTKDVDQTVLSTIKVIHVLLGIHASDTDENKPQTFGQKLLSSVLEVMQIQQGADKPKSESNKK